MFEAMCHFNIDDFTHFFATGEVMSAFSRPRVSQSYVFECSDAAWLALHMSSPTKFWSNLADAIERPSMFDDTRFADREGRIANYDALLGFLAPIFRERSLAEWCERLTRFEVPHSPLHTPAAVLATAQAEHLQLQVEAEHAVMGTFRSIRSPVSFDGERALDVVPPPVLGEHDEELKSAPCPDPVS